MTSARKPKGPTRRRRLSVILSAGGVVFRRVGETIEVVLVGRSAEGRWALPKGMPGPGEDLLHTARREVREETGLEVEIVCPITEIEYSFTSRGTLYRKLVRHFLFRAVGGDTSDHDPEHDLVEWVEAGVAATRLTFPNEVAVLSKAIELIQAGDRTADEANPDPRQGGDLRGAE
jgi:8-oxo-dGTP pyrophosphatase MutT (NUDIX family)